MSPDPSPLNYFCMSSNVTLYIVKTEQENVYIKKKLASKFFQCFVGPFSYY